MRSEWEELKWAGRRGSGGEDKEVKGGRRKR